MIYLISKPRSPWPTHAIFQNGPGASRKSEGAEQYMNPGKHHLFEPACRAASCGVCYNLTEEVFDNSEVFNVRLPCRSLQAENTRDHRGMRIPAGFGPRLQLHDSFPSEVHSVSAGHDWCREGNAAQCLWIMIQSDHPGRRAELGLQRPPHMCRVLLSCGCCCR